MTHCDTQQTHTHTYIHVYNTHLSLYVRVHIYLVCCCIIKQLMNMPRPQAVQRVRDEQKQTPQP